ncbi:MULTISPECIES: flippase [Bacillaceae]|uniref:flippase n=1 Tax=Bacillaceae TaxID=186817 RepID=UPI003000CCDB
MSHKKRLITNFLSLASVQGLNLILPLITLPYLMHVLGAGKFGLVQFAQALIQYFIIFTDYGFNLTATKEISLNRDDRQQVSKIFSSVMTVKMVLLIVCFLVMLLLVLFIPKFQEDSIIYFLTFGMAIGNALFPIWFFQGIEHMKVISILNIISKLIFTIGIFVLVKNSDQFLIVPLLNSLGYILIGVIALYIVLVKYKVKLYLPTKADIIFQLKEGWDIFISTFATTMYTTSNTFILGFFASNTVVGYYAGAERVIKAITTIIAPLIQTVYPYLSKALKESRQSALNMLNKLFILITVLMGILSLFVVLFAKYVVLIGPEYENSIPLLYIMAGLPLILGWANVFGTLTMINFDYKKQLSRIYIYSSIFSIVLIVLLIPTFKEVGTAYNSLLTELFATMLMAIFLWKKGIHIWKFKEQMKVSEE